MIEKFVFHVINNPFIPTNPTNCFDAYTIKIIKFCNMMHNNGHTIIFYGDDDAHKYIKARKFIKIIPTNLLNKLQKKTNNFEDPEYLMIGKRKKLLVITDDFNEIIRVNILDAIHKNYRYNKHEYVLQFFTCFKLSDDIININPSFGGGYAFNYDFVCFETKEYLEYSKKEFNLNPKIEYWINPWFDPSNYLFFPKTNKMTKTLLYLGRISKYKGYQQFLEFSTKLPDYLFILAGGCLKYDSKNKIIMTPENKINLNEYPNVRYVGVVKGEVKKHLLAKVTALIQPTQYVEPCGWNVIEAMLSGTPVLAPKSGGFIDTINNGVTGFLCEQHEWIDKIKEIHILNPECCRKWALDKFNEQNAYSKYMIFFNKINNYLTK
jgi:glycosyltransferase involved in cell wall biosynthesis